MSRLRHWPLLLLPLAFFGAECWLRQAALPYWLWFNLDPSYLYLIGGLNLLHGLPPAQFQHPGSPVQLLVALVAGLSPGDAIAQAEAILTRSSTLFFLLDALALAWLGRAIQRRFNARLPALFAQLAPFITMLALKHGIEVEPEPLLLLAVLLLTIGMVEESAAPRKASLWLLGFAIGFGAACKITFAPLGLAPLILIPSWRRRAAYVAISAFWFVLWMLPELGNLGPMIDWFHGLAANSGAYGQGPSDVVEWTKYPHAFSKLFFARPLFLIAFAAGAAALVRRARSGQAWTLADRALAGLLAAQLTQIALVAKHPSAHYILPALELAGPVLAFAWLGLRDVGACWVRRGFAVALAIILVAQSVALWKQHAELARDSKGARSVDLARDLPDCAHIYVFMASAPSAAWFYNDSYSGQRYAARLKGVMPAHDYFAVPWRAPLENWDGPVNATDLASRSSCIAVRAAIPNMAEDFVRANFADRFATAQKCSAGAETILVAGASCPAKN